MIGPGSDKNPKWVHMLKLELDFLIKLTNFYKRNIFHQKLIFHIVEELKSKKKSLFVLVTISAFSKEPNMSACYLINVICTKGCQ